ncbi:hypothetical protein H4R35_000897 [Dimargaris xerosporica]|nr:hypothetical protein H4R35_000897 [Dimargaris xerosporica]
MDLTTSTGMDFGNGTAEIASFPAVTTSDALGTPTPMVRTTTLSSMPSNDPFENGIEFASTNLNKPQIRQKIIDGDLHLQPPPVHLTAPCWEKFCLVKDANNRFLPYAACKLCHKVYLYRGKETSTMSMNQHRCRFPATNEPHDNLSLAMLASAAPSLTYEMRQALLKSCVNFICRDDRPLNMVADNVFLELLQTAVSMGSKYGQFSIRDIMTPPTPDNTGSTLLFTQNGTAQLNPADPNN